jgi:hypothetical protein
MLNLTRGTSAQPLLHSGPDRAKLHQRQEHLPARWPPTAYNARWLTEAPNYWQLSVTASSTAQVRKSVGEVC